MITGPNIIKNGLIFALDAGSTRCFSNGDTTATDLVQEFNCSGANGTPGSGTHSPSTGNFPAYNSVNGGVFDFAGGKGINIDGDLGTTTESSICLWFYKNSSNVQYFFDGRNDGGRWFLSNYNNSNINWDNNLRYNYESSYNTSASDFLNKWIFMVATSDSSGSKLYLNGSEVLTSTSTSVDEDFGKNFRIGTRYTTSASSQWTGYMGPIYFYNKVLTSSEVNQNYQVHKNRFIL